MNQKEIIVGASGSPASLDTNFENIQGNFTELFNPSIDYTWFYYNASSRADYMFLRQANTSRAYIMLSANELSLKQAGDTYGHDATLVLDYDRTKLYCIYSANQTDTSDSASSVNVFCRLQKIHANTAGGVVSIDSTITIAKNGDTVGGKTITSGAGVPNAYRVGDILHLLWTAKCDDGLWYMMHNTYDCSTDTLGTAEICTMDAGLMSCQTIATHLGLTVNNMISMNASIVEFNGYYYACACSYDNFPNGAILRTTDFVDWEFVFEPDFGSLESAANFEGALGAIGGHLYLALRQTDIDEYQDLNPLILAKFDTSHTLVDVCTIPSCQSRPAFFMRGTTELYLAYPNNNRRNTVCLLIGTYDLRDSIPMQDMHSAAGNGNYACIAPRTANLQFVAWSRGSAGISVSSMNGMQKTNLEAMAALTTALGF